jgi:hypothetical protein
LPIKALPVSVKNFQIEKIPKEITYDDKEHSKCTAPKTFEEHVDTLEDWERNLLRTTGNVRNTEDVCHQINTSNKTYMVSDGGMVNGYGSYGWIIANDSDIQKGRGEAEGSRNLMQSYQAKGYGMLAALRYILQAYRHTGIWPTSPKTVHMYCNNLALIQRIGWQEKIIVTTPKDVFRPDYDNEASTKETIEILRHHKIFIKEKHV